MRVSLIILSLYFFNNKDASLELFLPHCERRWHPLKKCSLSSLDTSISFCYLFRSVNYMDNQFVEYSISKLLWDYWSCVTIDGLTLKIMNLFRPYLYGPWSNKHALFLFLFLWFRYQLNNNQSNWSLQSYRNLVCIIVHSFIHAAL